MYRVSSSSELFLWHCSQVDDAGGTIRDFWVVADNDSNAEAAAREVIEENDDAPVGGFDWEVQLTKLHGIAAVNAKLAFFVANIGALPTTAPSLMLCYAPRGRAK